MKTDTFGFKLDGEKRDMEGFISEFCSKHNVSLVHTEEIDGVVYWSVDREIQGRGMKKQKKSYFRKEQEKKAHKDFFRTIEVIRHLPFSLRWQIAKTILKGVKKNERLG